ncbi:unnamed protein product [Aspergillus oryzae]|nr:unnamed protein product [Aspergillus oryzae]
MADISKSGSDAAHLEERPVVTTANPALADPATRARIEKSLKRKLDARCGFFVIIYIMNYLDRNNMAAARLKGLQDDLGLDYSQYATCLTVMLLWGLISTLSGVATNFAGMVCIRFFLGFVEAAFLPGALMILSKWYTRRELTTRNAILFCGNLISNAFSALVGAGVLSNMQGVLGHAAWRWLFWIILPDLPHNTRGFTKDELDLAQLRMAEDVGEADVDSEDQGPWDGLFMAVKDIKIYVMMITFTAYVVGLSFNAFFRAVAIAMINAFSQLGNVAGSYVWDLSENGYRKSYGIVTAMFGITIVGCYGFRMVLKNLNKELEEAETNATTEPESDETLARSKGFRYIT